MHEQHGKLGGEVLLLDAVPRVGAGQLQREGLRLVELDQQHRDLVVAAHGVGLGVEPAGCEGTEEVRDRFALHGNVLHNPRTNAATRSERREQPAANSSAETSWGLVVRRTGERM